MEPKGQLRRPGVASADDPLWAEERAGGGVEEVKDRQLGGIQIEGAAATVGVLRGRMLIEGAPTIGSGQSSYLTSAKVFYTGRS